MLSIRFGAVFLIFNAVFVGAQLETNPSVQTGPSVVNISDPSPKDLNQLNVAVFLPADGQIAGQPSNTPSPAAPGFVWLQVPVAQSQVPSGNPTVSQQPAGTNVQQNPIPAIQQPTGSPSVQIPEIPVGGVDLNKFCLKPSGQFPSRSCNKYVNCWAGVATEQSCVDGLLFNPKGYCDYAANVNCNGKPIEGSLPTPTSSPSVTWTASSPSSTNQSSSGHHPTLPGVTATTPALLTLPAVDPLLKSKCLKPRGQFPSTSCNKFVNCWDDTVLEQECPDGLLFSSKGYCDYPQNVQCGNRGTIPKTSSPSVCLLEYGTFRDRIKCNSYYTCASNKVLATYTCPEGFNFNDNLGVCDYEYRVDCSKEPAAFRSQKEDSDSSANKPESIPSSECEIASGTFRNKTNCSQYYTCRSYQVVARYDCPIGFLFNAGIGVCDYSSRVSCEEDQSQYIYKQKDLPELPADLMTRVDKCTPGTVFRLNPQCTAACLCRNGMAEIVQCPTGTAYDSAIDKCVAPEIARC